MNSHKITKNIRLSCISHLLTPVIIIMISVLLLTYVPFYQIFFPEKIVISADTPLYSSMSVMKSNKETHCTITFPKLEYTGYDLIKGNRTVGSYYYYVHDTTSIFVILDSDMLTEKSPVLYDYTVTACREEYDAMFNNMISLYAHDISWTPEGITSSSVGFLLSEIEHHTFAYIGLFSCCILLIFAALYIIAMNILYFIFPYALHPCYKLFRKTSDIPYKKQNRAIMKLDRDLSSDSILNFGSTYITNKYLVDTNRHTSVILPFKHIVWIYSSQHFKRILWFNIKLSSFMTIVTDTGHTTSIHWKPSDDARQVYSYVEENYPEILCKYSKDNKFAAKQRIRDAKQQRKLARKMK